MEILELLLDKVKLEDCLNLTKVLIENSEEILNVNSTIYPNLSKENYKNFRFDETQNGYIYFQLKNSKIFDLKFEFFELYILIYNNENELTLSFDFNEVNKIPLQNFIDFCKKMANALNKKFYYCGLEPAQDTSTQFFTYNGVGKIKW